MFVVVIAIHIFFQDPATSDIFQHDLCIIYCFFAENPAFLKNNFCRILYYHLEEL